MEPITITLRLKEITRYNTIVKMTGTVNTILKVRFATVTISRQSTRFRDYWYTASRMNRGLLRAMLPNRFHIANNRYRCGLPSRMTTATSLRPILGTADRKILPLKTGLASFPQRGSAG